VVVGGLLCRAVVCLRRKTHTGFARRL